MERAVWDVGNGKVYISRADLLERCDRDEVSAIGFPVGDVFQFDGGLYDRLERAYRRKDKRSLASTWSEAEAYLG